MTQRVHDSVSYVLRILSSALDPWLADTLSSALPPGGQWVDLLRNSDRGEGREAASYSGTDPALALRVLTDGSLVPAGAVPAWDNLDPLVRDYAGELLETRNRWAHHEELSDTEGDRSLDTARRLLARLHLTEAAEQCRALPEDAAQTESGPAARIELDTLSHLSLAMTMAGVQPVRQIRILGVERDSLGCQLELIVEGPNGAVAEPFGVRLDLTAGAETLLQRRTIALDAQAMVRIVSAEPARVQARLVDAAGTLLAEVSQQVVLEPPQFWRAHPLELGTEMLPAHIHPQSSVIAEVLREASDFHELRTRRKALDGYQSEDPSRVDSTVEAIWDALRDRRIAYTEPPASWGEKGQHIRTPQQVLVGQLGTCLDTTVTLAAALEQAGINSTLWLFPGHALLAYWRTDDSLGAAASTDVATGQNLVELDALVPLETTLLCAGEGTGSFREAVAAGRARVRHDVTIIGDLRAAREAGVRPLPSPASQDGESTIVEVQAPHEGADSSPHRRPAAAAGEGERRTGTPSTAEPQPRRVQDWKNSLLDLSLRNRLINYPARAGLRLAISDETLPELEEMLRAGQAISLTASDALAEIDLERGLTHANMLPDEERGRLLREKKRLFADVTSARYLTQLRSIANKARTVVSETGANNLYLVSGFLHWELEGRELRSPLVLTPVTLTTASRGAAYRVEQDQTGASTPNYCLLEKLRIALGLELPGLQEPRSDEAGMDVDGVLRSVRESLVASGQSFSVEASAELAILQFSRFVLWRDLDRHWASFAKNSLVQHLIDTPNRDFADPVPAAEQTDLDQLGEQVPVSADASQLDAITEAITGRTFVLEGPPGTGKSQTITNLLSHAMRSGKKVLFVAEKRAALDVVRKRMEAVGLGVFSLDLHDRDARPTHVRAQIRQALEHQSVDSAAELQRALGDAVGSRRRLRRYVEGVHSTNAAGFSLYAAHLTLLATQGRHAFELDPDLIAGLTQEQNGQLQELFRDLPEHTDRCQPQVHHPWGFLRRPPSKDTSVFAATTRLEAAIPPVAANPDLAELLTNARSAADVEAWAWVSRQPRLSLERFDQAADPNELGRLRSVEARVHELATGEPSWRRLFGASALELDVDDLHARNMAAAQTGFFARKRRQREVLASVAEHLKVPVPQVDLKQFTARTHALRESAQKLSDLRGELSIFPAGARLNPWLEDSRTELLGQLTTLVKTVELLGSSSSTDSALRRFYVATTPDAAASELEELAFAWREWEGLGLPSEDVLAWRAGQPFLLAWQSSARSHVRRGADELRGWLALLAHLEPLRRPGLAHLHAAALDGAFDVDEAVIAFERGTAQASVTERLRAANLVGKDLRTQDAEIARFGQTADTIRGLLPEVLPAEVAARRSFDANASAGRIGQLRRQLERQRGGLSVRGLMQQFGDIVTSVMPCVLISPQSVGRYFPADAQLFDLVVFDEASQIRVADAVGAMGRGRSVVVVGDSKQMPPTNFAQVSVLSSDEDTTSVEYAADEESILTECVAAAVPRKRLTWHYRSQDESLIAFSNRQYYDDRLSSFPAPAIDATDLGVCLIRVDGQFDRRRGSSHRTNRVEADAIVANVIERFQRSPEAAPSLGVITFNAQQRDLIDNLLRDLDDERITAALEEPDGLFVKNLENVQGDERDTIIFSIAFSKNERGVLPLNFGPLTAAGGERRLNVAITRARRQVVLYTSFDPADIRETTSVGVSHLKAYLQLAQAPEPLGASMRLASRDAHRDDIAAALRARGLDVATDVGLSEFRIDLTVARDGEPHRLAIMLDGESWARRRTVADRDDLPARFLTATMGWGRVLRIWLPRWLADQDAVVADVERALAGSDTAPPESPASVETVDSPEQPVSPETADSPVSTGAVELPAEVTESSAPTSSSPPHASLTGFAAWAPKEVSSINVLDRLPAPKAREQVRRVLRDAIETEGPIHRDRLVKLTAEAFGLSRVTTSRTNAILACLPANTVQTEDAFCWPPDTTPSDWRGVRTSESMVRPIEHIAPAELINALRVSAERLGGAEEEDLMREALSLFGGRRLTAGIRARLSEAVTAARQAGVLDQTAHGLRAKADG